MWRQLRGAYGIDVFNVTPIAPVMSGVSIGHFSTMEECLDASTGIRIFFEPDGDCALSDIPSGDKVLVFGNTNQGNGHLSRPEDICVKIPSLNPTDLYGVNAAAIVLHYLHGQ